MGMPLHEVISTAHRAEQRRTSNAFALKMPPVEKLAARSTVRLEPPSEPPLPHRLSLRPRDLKDATDLFHLRKLAVCVLKVTRHQ